MTTIFALLVQVCGLSHREAANFLNVRLDTVRSWSSGRNQTPEGVNQSLTELADRIDGAADEFIQECQSQVNEFGEPDVVEFVIASDDEEAQSLGWPCVGAHRAVLALAVARGMAEGYRFRVVPQGSTVAAAANNTHREEY